MGLAIVSHPKHKPARSGYEIGKRLMDCSICVLLLPVVLPLIALSMLAIRLNSPGPVIFAQNRVGKGERRFRMYKLRTIRHDLDLRNHRGFMKDYVRRSAYSRPGEQIVDRVFDKSFRCGGDSPAVDTTVNKPIENWQVTRVGKVLRKTSLDELPQIVNVLKGEMSIVGPRPNVPWEVEECLPWHYERLEVLPGITGLAQIRGRSCITFDQIARADIEYVQKRSLALDFKILYWTFRSVLSRQGAE